MASTDKFILEGERIRSVRPKPPQEHDPLGDGADGKAAFSSALIAWFGENGRDYPWRRTRDPYAVLVSEVMLQQTRVNTVLSRRYFENWLEQFPDVVALADANEADILKAWEGLGYYRRARNLQRAARAVVEDFGGEFPETAGEIQRLSGVGRYTAGAVASFACGQAAAIVDGNIARVLARIFDFAGEIDSTSGQRQLWHWAESLLPAEGEAVRIYNSALMELGQTLCNKSAPKCDRCPVAAWCASQDPESLPRKKAAAKVEAVTERVVFVEARGRILLEKVPAGQRREGMWRLPLLAEVSGGAPPPPPPSASSKADACLSFPELLRLTYGITRYRVEMIVHRMSEVEAKNVFAPATASPSDADAESFSEAPAPERRWFGEKQTAQIAMPSPYRRALDQLRIRIGVVTQ